MKGFGEGIGGIVENINVFLKTHGIKLIFAFGVLLISIFLRRVFVFFVLKGISLFVRRTKTKIDDILFRAVSRPLSFIFILVGIWVALRILGIEADILRKVLWSFAIFIFGWISFNFVKEFEPYFFEFAKRFGEDFATEIGGFLVRLTRIFIFITVGLSILQMWGINVTTIIASLGIGGLAVALAAKDTLANIIGGLILLADKTIKVGETVRVGDIAGTVEEVGLRATRIRTFDKTLVTIPNQNLTTTEIDNWSRREIRRVRMYVGVTYSTTRQQMINILKEIRQMLMEHPGVFKGERFFVFFEEFADSSLNILVQYYTVSADYGEYLAIREDVNLKIMEIVERNGSSFAFPSRSIYVETPLRFSETKPQKQNQ